MALRGATKADLWSPDFVAIHCCRKSVVNDTTRADEKPGSECRTPRDCLLPGTLPTIRQLPVFWHFKLGSSVPLRPHGPVIRNLMYDLHPVR